ncbi:MAG: hypothetical protein KDB69_01925, partial [Acidimicrobiia bacterium]|nr:hypothetical protein [Acidimicrobiia bacterium]
MLDLAYERDFLGVVFHRLLQTVKLERDAFVWMDFNDRATGDAAILVAITQILLAIGTGTSIVHLLNPFRLLEVLISAAVFWLLYSAATWAIVRFLFDGYGSFAVYLRVAGFAFPTLLLLIFASFVTDTFFLVLLIGAAWFVVIVARGIGYISDLDATKSFLAAIGGYAAVVVVQSILSGLRLF